MWMTRTHARACTHTRTYARERTHARTHPCTRTCTHARARTHARTHAHTHAHTHTRAHTLFDCTHAHTHVCGTAQAKDIMTRQPVTMPKQLKVGVIYDILTSKRSHASDVLRNRQSHLIGLKPSKIFLLLSLDMFHTTTRWFGCAAVPFGTLCGTSGVVVS